eukprot:8194777-Alexandrium_andersonii.AAC.1
MFDDSRAPPEGPQRRVFSGSAGSSAFQQFRAVSSSILRSLSGGGYRPPGPPAKSASGAPVGGVR